MLRKLSFVSGLFVMAAVLSPHIASAATIEQFTVSPGVVQAGDALVHKAQWDYDWRYRRRDYGDDWRYRRYEYGRFGGYYSRCHYGRHECARRWGWGGWEFRRCLWRHGCGGGGY